MAAEPFSTPIGMVQGHVSVIPSNRSLAVVPNTNACTGFVEHSGSMNIALQLMPRCSTCPSFHERIRWKITGGPTRRGVCKNGSVGTHNVPADGSGFCHQHPEIKKASP